MSAAVRDAPASVRKISKSIMIFDMHNAFFIHITRNLQHHAPFPTMACRCYICGAAFPSNYVMTNRLNIRHFAPPPCYLNSAATAGGHAIGYLCGALRSAHGLPARRGPPVGALPETNLDTSTRVSSWKTGLHGEGCGTRVAEQRLKLILAFSFS